MSSSNNRFLVAKYIPDMRRLEPRNIGVIVWIDGTLSARFLGEQAEGDETTHAPRRLGIASQDTYRDWIHYWRSQLAAPMLSVNGNGHRVSRDSLEFVDALRQRSKENFVLVDGGFIPEQVHPADIDEVVNDLFAGLVEDENESRESHEEDSALLKKAVSTVFRSSGIESMEGYKAKIPLGVSVESHMFAFTFDWGVYTKTYAPRVVFQHALLSRPMTVNSAAFMFSCLSRADYQPYRLGRDRCLSIVRTTPSLLNNNAAHGELEKLKAYSTVVDVSDEDRSVNELRRLSLSL